MKFIKRVSALLLCLCMLLGLPMSVQAVNIPTGNGLKLINAYAMSNRFVHSWTNGTGGNANQTDHCVMLYFNDKITDAYHIRNNNYVKLYIEPYKADGTSLGLQNAGFQAVDYYGNTAGANKKVVVLRFGTQNGSSFSASANGFSYWKGQGAVGFRLYIVDNKGTGINNRVDGWATSISYGWTLVANNTHGGRDAVIQEILFEEDCLAIRRVIKADDSKLLVQFNQPVAMHDLIAQNGPIKIELHATTGTHLNANKQPANASGVTSADLQTVNQRWAAQSAKVMADAHWVEVDFGGTAVADAVAYAKANSNGLFIQFAENSAATKPIWGANGEQTDNGLIDGIWSTQTNSPLLAVTGKHRPDVAGDTTYHVLSDALQVKAAEIREDNTLLIRFSEAIMLPTTAVSASLGLYDATNQKLADYDWSVSVSKDNASYYGSSGDALLVSVPSVSTESIRSIAADLEAQGYTLRLTLTSADGEADGFISEIAAMENAEQKLLASTSAPADSVQINVTGVETKLLKLEKVDAYKENTLVLTFNQDVVVDSAKHYMGLTLVDNGGNCYQSYDAATGTYTIVRGNPQDGKSKPAQWNLTYKGYFQGKKNMVYATVDATQGNFTSSSVSDWNFSKIMEFCENYTQGKLMLRIQESNGNQPNSGTVDSIHADGDVSNKLLATLGGNNDQVQYEIADFRNDIIVESTKLIESNLIEITFNKPVTNSWYSTTEHGSAMLRLSKYDEATGQWTWYRYDGKEAGVAASTTPTQWGWSLSSLFNYDPHNTPAGTEPAATEAAKVWYYKWNSSTTDILDILSMISDPDSVFAADGVQLTMVFEKSGNADSMLVNCVQNYTTADGKYYLYDNDALQWRHHSAVTTSLAVPSMLKVTDVTVTDESNMTLTFNKDVASFTKTDAVIRLVDANGNLADKMVLSVKAVSGNKVALAARNATAEKYRSFSKVWQVAQANNWSMTLALVQADEDVLRDGMLSGVAAIDGSYLLGSELSADTLDALYLSIGRQNYAFNPESFTITSVKQVAKSALVVEFSEDIQLYNEKARPFVALRMVDPIDHELIRLTDDGEITKVAAQGKTVMQWSSQKVEFYGERKDALMVTFSDTLDIGLLVSKVNMDAKFIPYEVMFCIEETSDSTLAPDRIKGNYLVYNIRRADDHKQLESSSIKNTNSGLNDAVLVPIQALDPAADLLVEDVQVIDQTRIVVSFSEAVKINNPGGYIGLVDSNLTNVKNENGFVMRWWGSVKYYDDAHTQVVFTLNCVTSGDADAKVNGLHDLYSRGYEKDGKTLMLLIGDATNKSNSNGIVDSIVSTTGKLVHADPMTGIYDAIYLNVNKEEIPQGELTITDVVVVSDIEAIVTFSAPVEIVDGPYMALRLMTEDNFLISKSPEGKFERHQKGYDPMQWSANWKWNNEEHTQIKMSIGNGPAGYENFNKMLSTDWESLFPGAHITIGGEENNAAVIENNGRMDNIRLVADERVRLIANSKLGTRDGCFISLSKVDYTQKKLTGSARIINELQIRISFSEPVEITDTPYISMRYIDEETNRVYYAGDEYNRAPVQFGGNWKWENDSHTSIIWTMVSSNSFGPCNLYDVVNYQYALEMMTGRKMQLCIEEKSGKNISVGSGNGLVDNISTLDKKNHLQANVSSRGLLDGLYMDLNLGVLRDLKPLTLVSATAINDQTIELKFSEPIMMSADNMPSITLRYVSESGKADVLTNGKMANFKGDIAVKEGDPSVLVWTLNSKQVENLTDLFNYNGIFRWNNTSKLSLVISDAQEDAPPKTMRLRSIKALDGIRFLQAPYSAQPELMADVTVAYDIPAPEQTTEGEQAPEIEYYSDYTQHIILGAALIAVGVVVLLIVCFKKKGGKA